MRIEVCASATEANQRAATLIAEQLRGALAERGRASVALSGGRTPQVMLQSLAAVKLAWADVHVLQVDERIVPIDDERRNLTSIRRAFAQSSLPDKNIHGMPVNSANVAAGAAEYCRVLKAIAGDPPRIDVVHLGLGADGHTASLVFDDAALDAHSDVAISGLYQGTQRITLTLHAIDRARCRLWLVTGGAKRDIVRRFLAHDPGLVASRVSREAGIVVLDKDSGGE